MTQQTENIANAEPALNDQVPQPVVAAAPATASTGGFLGNLILIFLVACAASLTVNLIQETLFPKADPTQKVVVVGVNNLIQDQIGLLGERGRTGEIPLEEMPKRSKAFSEALLAELRTYTDDGYIVMRMDSLIAKPETLEDLTPAIRKTLQSKGLMEKPNQEIKP